MPEIKNTFIKSKMNKDLDDRLLSKGEYRNAQNVNISRSEGEDVGSLENVLGNTSISNLMPSESALLGLGIEVIGFFEDDTNNCVYTFSTNYTDPSVDQLSQDAPYFSENYIVKTDLKSNKSQILVMGGFLNFSQSHPIYGVNLIEDLLFWTDNRNQPRKINVKSAVSLVDAQQGNPPPGIYYTNEDQISVSKYYPHAVPKLFNKFNVTVTAEIGPDVVTGDYKYTVSAADAAKIRGGMMVLRGAINTWAQGSSQLPDRYVIATSVNGANSYFLTNLKVVIDATVNTIVPIGFSENKNVGEEFLDYSIIGAIFRENTAIQISPSPLNLQEILNPLITRSSSFTAFADNVQGVYNDVSFTVSPAGGSGAVINVTIGPGTGQSNVTKIEITSGGSNFSTNDLITISSSNFPAGGSAINWTLNFPSLDLAQIRPPSADSKIFYWSGSSIPYTKMKVDVPGILSAAGPGQVNTIAASNFVGTIGGDDYYEIRTTFAHNIANSTIPNAVAYAEFSWPNPNFNNAAAGSSQAGSTFAGDPEFLKERFSRFAYRFKFDDGEYSLISPFTQPAFIPRQKGFIQDGVSLVSTGVSDTGEGNSNVPGTPFQRFATGEEDIQASSIVSFFENSVDTVNLQITTPYPLFSLRSKLGVIEIDIIYKESDALAIKIVDTISESEFKYQKDGVTLNYSNIFEYNYESQEPFKLVSPTKEIERVFDKVPIRALSQESSGGRIIYGNFIDKHSSLNSLKYNIKVSEKPAPLTSNITLAADQNTGIVPNDSFLSYPTHTLKQNRNYQVGFVFSDRYGRQSDVILGPSNNDQYYIGAIPFGQDTVFSPYFDNTLRNGSNDVAVWRGNMLEVLLRETIPATTTEEGYPGLYNSGEYQMDVATTQNGVNTVVFVSVDPRIKVGDVFVSANAPTDINIAISITGTSITFSGSQLNVSPNSTLASGQFIDGTGVIQGASNVLGWCSYKIVVKQLTQDYYNAYLGNVSYLSPNAALSTAVGNYPFSGSSFVTSLVADNVNKIPADLVAVAPEQLQFGTSDALLYPRVGATTLQDSSASDPTNYLYAQNFVLGTETASINAYGKIQDIGVAELAGTSPNFTGFKIPAQSRGVQAAASNPTAIILSMPNGEQIGRQYWRPPGLYIYEIGALQSKIEIFWETSTCDLISNLNKSFSEGPTPTLSLPAAPTTPDTPADGENTSED